MLSTAYDFNIALLELLKTLPNVDVFDKASFSSELTTKKPYVVCTSGALIPTNVPITSFRHGSDKMVFDIECVGYYPEQVNKLTAIIRNMLWGTVLTPYSSEIREVYFRSRKDNIDASVQPSKFINHMTFVCTLDKGL